jgi:glycosyltransferase involved in cell wall biosynthesis
MNVTVTICTWNRARLLDQALAQIHHLRIPAGVEWEVLVVNNNCTDDTDQVLTRHAEVLPLRRAFEPKPGIANARDCALRHARGEFQFSTDDDALVDPDWFAAYYEAFQRWPQAGFFAGPIEPWFESPPPPQMKAAFESLAIGYCGIDRGKEERLLRPDESPVGCNMAFRRRLAEPFHYDPRLGRNREQQLFGEETAFCNCMTAAGIPGVWVPSAKVRHYVPAQRMELAYLKRFYAGLGQSMVRMGGVADGTRLAGVPRWVIRRYLGTWLSRFGHLLRRDRVGYYQTLVEQWRLGGIIREYRAVHSSQPARPS